MPFFLFIFCLSGNWVSKLFFSGRELDETYLHFSEFIDPWIDWTDCKICLLGPYLSAGVRCRDCLGRFSSKRNFRSPGDNQKSLEVISDAGSALNTFQLLLQERWNKKQIHKHVQKAFLWISHQILSSCWYINIYALFFSSGVMGPFFFSTLFSELWLSESWGEAREMKLMYLLPLIRYFL